MRRVLILGAGGRDFHNFNTFFRENSAYKVIGFTASNQIPGVGRRLYPPELAGELYPKGIPIYEERELPRLLKEKEVDVVIFAYSDVSFEYVMEKASIAQAAGADFWLLGPKATALKARRPVIAICAVRTGAGKSPTTRKVCSILKEKGINFCVVRHPMAYNNLEYKVQVFKEIADLDKYQVTIEEREEYEPHIKMGNTVLAGVDYAEILREAEKYDLIVWDGGNNDFPFFKPDFLIVLLDALRPGHEVRYHPGMTLLLMADLILINKVDEAKYRNIAEIRKNIRRFNPRARVLETYLEKRIEGDFPAGKRVLVVEDGPSVTHGELGYGAGYQIARERGLKILDPRKFAVGTIKKSYERYPHLAEVIPALGYQKKQIADLTKTINRSRADFVISGTPGDLRRLIKTKKPIVQVTYSLRELKEGRLKRIIKRFLKRVL